MFSVISKGENPNSWAMKLFTQIRHDALFFLCILIWNVYWFFFWDLKQGLGEAEQFGAVVVSEKAFWSHIFLTSD